MSFKYLNKRIEKDKLEKWNSMWQNNIKKSKYYKLHNSNSQPTFFQNFSNNEKLIFSTFLQMKIRHDFFKFYLYRLFTYKSNRCDENCNEIQIFEHLLLDCYHYFNAQKQLKKNIKISVSLRTLFKTNENLKIVLNFIKNIRIFTKKMNSKHREERKNVRKKVKKFKIDREILERLSKIREKKRAFWETTRRVYSTLTRRKKS